MRTKHAQAGQLRLSQVFTGTESVGLVRYSAPPAALPSRVRDSVRTYNYVAQSALVRLPKIILPLINDSELSQVRLLIARFWAFSVFTGYNPRHQCVRRGGREKRTSNIPVRTGDRSV